MPKFSDLKWFYGIGLAFMALSAVAYALDFYYIAALPMVPILFYLIFNHTEKLLYFLAFATPLSVPVQDIGGGIGMSIPTEPLIFILFSGFLFQLVSAKTFDRRLLTHPLTILILLDILWMIVSSVGSTMPMVSFKYTLARVWYVFVFYLGMVHLFKKEQAMKIFLWCFSISTAILVLYTLKNHAAESFSRLYSYTAMRPFLPDHGMYAAAISFVIPPMFIWLIYGNRMHLSKGSRTIAGVVALIVTVGVVFSFTRASWLSLVVAGGVYALLLLKIRFRTVAILGVVMAGLFLTFQSLIWQELSRNKQDSDDDIGEHVQSFSNVSTDPSNLERLNRWSCAYRMLLDKPILGFGPGTYTYQYGPYQISSEMSIISTNSGDLGNVHSEYLRPLAESGIIGGILFLLIVLCAINLGFEVHYHSSFQSIRYLNLGALLGLVTYFAHGFLNNYSDFDKIAVPMWGFMAIIMASHLYHIQNDDKRKGAA